MKFFLNDSFFITRPNDYIRWASFVFVCLNIIIVVFSKKQGNQNHSLLIDANSTLLQVLAALRLYKGIRIFYINYSSSSKACLAKSKIDFSHVRFSGVLSSSCFSDSVSFSSILGPSSATTTGSCFFLRLG